MKILNLKSQSRLRGLRAYLAGPIDRAPDSGRTWRLALTPELNRRGVVVFDPMRKPINEAPEDDESRKARRQFKCPKGYNDFSSIMRRIAAVDLGMVNRSDFVIAYIDLDVHTCGTYEEVMRANDQKKPVLFVCKQGKESIPDWLFRLPHEFFFDTFDELLEYLDELAYAKRFEHHKRWLFFDFDELYPKEIFGLM